MFALTGPYWHASGHGCLEGLHRGAETGKVDEGVEGSSVSSEGKPAVGISCEAPESLWRVGIVDSRATLGSVILQVLIFGHAACRPRETRKFEILDKFGTFHHFEKDTRVRESGKIEYFGPCAGDAKPN